MSGGIPNGTFIFINKGMVKFRFIIEFIPTAMFFLLSYNIPCLIYLFKYRIIRLTVVFLKTGIFAVTKCFKTIRVHFATTYSE